MALTKQTGKQVGWWLSNCLRYTCINDDFPGLWIEEIFAFYEAIICC